jgi:hypothetical protein
VQFASAASTKLTFPSGLVTAFSGTNKAITINITLQLVTTAAAASYFFGGDSSVSAQPIRAVGENNTGWRVPMRNDAGGALSVNSATAKDANRHQLTLVDDGTNRTIYLDGVSIATASAASGALTCDRVTLGRTPLSTNNDFRTPGVQVYGRALTAPELALLWQYNRDHFGGLP